MVLTEEMKINENGYKRYYGRKGVQGNTQDIALGNCRTVDCREFIVRLNFHNGNPLFTSK